jgi:predicted nucleic acid-binding protein
VLLVDTGVLVAAADLDDRDHQVCAALLETHPGPIVTSALVVTEAGWLIRRQLDIATEAAFYQAIADGGIEVIALASIDWSRIAVLLDNYTDIGLDAADASLIAVAERLNQTTIATLDEEERAGLVVSTKNNSRRDGHTPSRLDRPPPERSSVTRQDAAAFSPELPDGELLEAVFGFSRWELDGLACNHDWVGYP